MYINSISAIKMGSQSKHLKPPYAVTTGTLKNRASARNRHHRARRRTDGRRETRIALVARESSVRPRGSPTVQLLWDQPSSSGVRVHRPVRAKSTENHPRSRLLRANEERKKNRATEFRKRWRPGLGFPPHQTSSLPVLTVVY